MAEKELKTRVEKLVAKTKKLKDSLQRSTDILEIMHLQGMYGHLLGVNMNRILDDYHAIDDPRLKDEIAESGLLEGSAAVKHLSTRRDTRRGQGLYQNGTVAIMFSCTPCIVLSKDGKTAKGQWDMWAPHGMTNTPYPGDERKMLQYYYWGKYDNEFSKGKDGKWWCFDRHIIAYFRTPYETGWVREPDCRRLTLRKDASPPRLCSLMSFYHPDGVFNPVPPPPEPEE